MKRKIIQQLKLWKDNPARKPLILLGARQVGKNSLGDETFWSDRGLRM